MKDCAKTINQVLKNETRRRKTTFWGKAYIIKPVLCSKIFGNGQQLVYLATIDQRPHYWLIRIDSSIDVEADDFDYEKHLLEPLEEEFGRYTENPFIDAAEFKKLKKEGDIECEEFDNYKDFKDFNKYPRLFWGGGHWGVVAKFKNGKQV